MTFYRHQIISTAPRAAAAGARRLADAGPVFGVFTPQTGLSSNHVVMLRAFESEAAAQAAILPDDMASAVERDELWAPDPRPLAGETFPEADGFFSHRWYDIAETDWPRFRELSVTAWDNFEALNQTRVIGFWRSRVRPAPDQLRIWLMAWYESLAAWQGSRWQLHGSGEAQAYDNLRARNQLTIDSAVSLLRRTV